VRWVATAAFQKSLSALPRAERVNYLLQRHVTHRLPAPQERLRRKFRRAVAHLEAYERYGPGRPLPEAVFYEFGAGWDLAVPLSYWTLGVERQVLVDVRPNVSLSLVGVNLERLARLGPDLAVECGRELRQPGTAPLGSAAELKERLGIRYLAPWDARRTGLDSASVDFVSSTVTLEHVPQEDVVPLLAECRRILRPDGILSAVIDLSDHCARRDRSIGPYNFLRYSDRTWRMLNPGIQHQNRLRSSDYRAAFGEAGLEVAFEEPKAPSDRQLASLQRLDLAERFRSYALEDLAVLRLRVVARPAAGGSPDALVEREHVGG
jgi:SAM-dependent methyltransferase